MTTATENNEKTYKPTSLVIDNATCLLKEIKLLPSGVIVANASILSGADKDGNQNFLNGSFVLPERFNKLIGTFPNLRVKCSVANLSCEYDSGFMNYRGFINSITF